jgi:hypothetical protein
MVGAKNRVPMLRVKLRDFLNLLWIFFFGLTYCGCDGRYWSLLQFFKVSLGIISFKDQIMDLFLKELNDGIALSDYMVTLVDLIFSMKDGLIPCCDDLILLSHQGSKLVNLSDLSISLPIVTSRGIDQLTHFTM